MAAIDLTEARVDALKADMRKYFPNVQSSHLTEALAAAAGFKTHAALRAALAAMREDDVSFVILNDAVFLTRLAAFGYAEKPAFSFDRIQAEALVRTAPPVTGPTYTYDSKRTKAWRNLLVSAVNAALDQKLISLRPGDNRWPDAEWDPKKGRAEPKLFDFTVAELPARGYLHNIGVGELTIHAAVNPKGNVVCASNAGFHAGDAFAASWLERATGAWLQSSTSLFACRKALLPVLAGIEVDPRGYGDRGRVIM